MNSVTVSLGELSGLAPGDLLVLRRRIDLAGALVVAGQDMFHASVARRGQQRAAKLLERSAPSEAERKTPS
jgi:flagellar motor switch protein FliM